MKKHTFISAASRKSETSDFLYKYLNYLDLSVFYYNDGKGNRLGAKLWKEIHQEINSSDFFLALISNPYAKSNACMRELRRAILLQKYGYTKILPLLEGSKKSISGINQLLESFLKNTIYEKVESNPISRTKLVEKILESMRVKDSKKKVAKLTKIFAQVPTWAIDSCMVHHKEGILDGITLGDAVSLETGFRLFLACTENKKYMKVSKPNLLGVGRRNKLFWANRAKTLPVRHINKVDLAEMISKILHFEYGREGKMKIKDFDAKKVGWKEMQSAIRMGLFNLDKEGFLYPKKTLKTYELLHLIDQTLLIYGGRGGGGDDYEIFKHKELFNGKKYKFEMGILQRKDRKVSKIYFKTIDLENIKILKINSIEVPIRISKRKGIVGKSSAKIELLKKWLLIFDRSAKVEILFKKKTTKRPEIYKIA